MIFHGKWMFEMQARSIESVIMSFTSTKSPPLLIIPLVIKQHAFIVTGIIPQFSITGGSRRTLNSNMSTSSSTSLDLPVYQPWSLATPLPRSEDDCTACLRQVVACARTLSTHVWSMESVGEQGEHCAPLHCVAWQMSRR
jgi:hypothetical protein